MTITLPPWTTQRDQLYSHRHILTTCQPEANRANGMTVLHYVMVHFGSAAASTNQ